jgi:hypothetical protein
LVLAVRRSSATQLIHVVVKPKCSKTSSRNDQATVSKALVMSVLNNIVGFLRTNSCLAEA